MEAGSQAWGPETADLTDMAMADSGLLRVWGCFRLMVSLVLHWKYLICSSVDSGKCISVLVGGFLPLESEHSGILAFFC